MAPVASRTVNTTCATRSSQWGGAKRRSRVRGRESKQLPCVKQASTDIRNSSATVTAAEDLLTDVNKITGNHTEHFPAIAETARSKKKETSNEDKNISATRSRNDSLSIASVASDTPSDTSSQHGLESPFTLLSSSAKQCGEMIAKLDRCDGSEKHDLLRSLKKDLLRLSLSKHGSPVVQKIIEVAAGSDRDAIIEELADHVCELYESPHGNFVVSVAIQVFPPSRYTFVLSALQRKGFVAVSKHKFGCRVMCRLIEHCREDQLDEFMGEILGNIESLARHRYGNFVVQSIIEQGSAWQSAWRASVISKLLQVFPSLCMDRSGSLVAQKVIEICDDDVNSAIERLNKENLIEVACSRYGSYVIEQLASMRSSYTAAQQSADILSKGICELQSSEYAQKVIGSWEP